MTRREIAALLAEVTDLKAEFASIGAEYEQAYAAFQPVAVDPGVFWTCAALLSVLVPVNLWLLFRAVWTSLHKRNKAIAYEREERARWN